MFITSLITLVPFVLLYVLARMRHEPTPAKTALIAAALWMYATRVVSPLISPLLYAQSFIDPSLLGPFILSMVFLTIIFRWFYATIQTAQKAFFFALLFSVLEAIVTFGVFAYAMSSWGGPL